MKENKALGEKEQREVNELREEISGIESILYEKEAILQRIEEEIELRREDKIIRENLEDLRRRCKGFKGRFFELITPI